jgi:hypothetical protein
VGWDITYVRTWEGWLYLSFVLDTYSRKRRRLVHGEQSQNGACAGCGEHGDLHSPALAQADPSLRQSKYGWVFSGGLTHTPIGFRCLSLELSAVRKHPPVRGRRRLRDLIGAWPRVS